MQNLYIFDLIISHSYHMNLSINSIAAASDITKKGNIDLIISFVTIVLYCLPAIC